MKTFFTVLKSSPLLLKQTVVCLLTALVFLTCSAMTPIPDADLSDVTGQALFQMNKQVIGSVSYYRMALDVELDMNMNIANLQLGRTNTGTDISATNVSFGCVADSGGNCITSGAATTKSQLKTFNLTRPYMEFAILNDNNATTRQVVGVRLGAEQVNGPLSFGTLSAFSGYLSGTTTIQMLGTCAAGSPYCPSSGNYTTQNSQASRDGGIPTTPPCGTANGSNSNFPGCSGANDWVGEPYTAPGYTGCGTPATNLCGSMGLADDSATFAGTGAWLHELAVGFGSQTVADTSGRTVIPVQASGTRQGYAYIQHINFQSSITALINDLQCNRTTNSYGCGLISALLPILSTQVNNTVGGQIKSGMDPNNPGNVNLSDLTMPYNLKNIHQLNISSNSFGLSFQSQAITYPGYVDANGATVNVNPGWAMYALNAFNLPISQYTWNFTNGITSGAARNGNIVALPGPYNNCWGSSNFC